MSAHATIRNIRHIRLQWILSTAMDWKGLSWHRPSCHKAPCFIHTVLTSLYGTSLLSKKGKNSVPSHELLDFPFSVQLGFKYKKRSLQFTWEALTVMLEGWTDTTGGYCTTSLQYTITTINSVASKDFSLLASTTISEGLSYILAQC